MRIEVQEAISASPEVVFGALADVERWPSLMPDILRVEVLTAGPVGVGTQFREVRRMYGREAAEVMTVAEFDPPRLLVLTAENHGTRYRAEHRIAPSGSGCVVSLGFEGVPVSPLARLVSPLLGFLAGSLARKLKADLAALKAAVERPAG